MEPNIEAVDADGRLANLLDRVERGELVTITRRGVPVARLVPIPQESEKSVRASELLRALRACVAARGGPPFTVDELLSLRDEGRR